MPERDQPVQLRTAVVCLIIRHDPLLRRWPTSTPSLNRHSDSQGKLYTPSLHMCICIRAFPLRVCVRVRLCAHPQHTCSTPAAHLNEFCAFCATPAAHRSFLRQSLRFLSDTCSIPERVFNFLRDTCNTPESKINLLKIT